MLQGTQVICLDISGQQTAYCISAAPVLNWLMLLQLSELQHKSVDSNERQRNQLSLSPSKWQTVVSQDTLWTVHKPTQNPQTRRNFRHHNLLCLEEQKYCWWSQWESELISGVVGEVVQQPRSKCNVNYWYKLELAQATAQLLHNPLSLQVSYTQYIHRDVTNTQTLHASISLRLPIISDVPTSQTQSSLLGPDLQQLPGV